MATINKILKKLIFPKWVANDSEIIEYITTIKDTFNSKLDKIKSHDKISDLLHLVMNDLSQIDSLAYIVYKKDSNDLNVWKKTDDNSKWHLSEIQNSNPNLEKQINIKSFIKKNELTNEQSQNEFFHISLPDEDEFLIEILGNNSNHILYFKSELENFIKNYRQQKEIHKLQDEKKENEKKIQESEKKVVSANKEIRRKVYDLHNLVEASNDIYSILDFKQLINSSLLTIIGQVGFQKAFVLLYDNNTKLFNQAYHKGFISDNFENLEFDLSSPIVPYFFKNRTPLYISKLERNKKLKNFAKSLKNMGILVVAPLIYSERLQGIIGAGEKLQFQNFTEADFEIFHILVNIISISIGNSKTFQEIKTLSLTDAMTNLHNYRYFEDRMKEELNRAKRHDKNLSLMILDIDHFKNYNDTLGHLAGDEILRMIGKILKETIRDEDIVARYGGEEFCIILPGIEKKGIPILGERVRKRVEAEKFFKEEVQPAGKITISIGTATFPDDADNYSDLVEKADKALYQAKNAGRNQLKIYDDKNIGE